jgi:hypothetical protein
MASKHDIIVADYQGFAVSFTDDGWFDATSIAARFNKRPVDWLRLEETKAYLEALCDALGISGSGSLIRSKRNSGTWLHPKLAVRFAQWLDLKFAVWCDMQIEGLLRGTHPIHDRKRLRHEAAASYKVMSQILQLTREAQGKTSAPHHYINEAKLVNWAASGKFQALERDSLPAAALDLLAKLEERNAVLIGLGKPYDERKAALQAFAAVWIAQRAAQLERAA